MKKVIPFFILVFSFVFNKKIIAQKSVFMSAKAGIILSDIKTKPDTLSTENKLGFPFGISIHLLFKGKKEISRTSVFMELNYMPLGYIIKEKDIDLVYKLNYLIFSVSSRIYLFTHDKTISGYYISGGPYINYLLWAKESGIIAGNGINKNLKSALKSFDFGISVGTGVSFKGFYSIEYNYNFGLSSINSVSEGTFHRNHSLYVRFSYPISYRVDISDFIF